LKSCPFYETIEINVPSHSLLSRRSHFRFQKQKASQVTTIVLLQSQVQSNQEQGRAIGN